MSSSDDLTLDCQTCVAVNTTACGECVVNHLLANDAGPIDFVPSPSQRAPERACDTQRVVELFAKAGLIDEHAHFVAYADFESVEAAQLTR